MRSRRSRQGIAALLTLAGAGSACAVNPVSGRPELVLVSERQEVERGAQEARRVEASLGLLPSSPLTRHVEALGQRLAAHSPRSGLTWAFRIVELTEPNAFALPGGHVYLSRGVLALLNSEDELAGVIGHEIAHVAARHAVQRATRAAPLALLTGAGALVTGIVSPLLGDLTASFGGLATDLLFAPYGRGQEREADRVGQQIAARAGWDPAALSDFLHTLEREEALRGRGETRPAFLSSHPSTPERVARTARQARELSRGPRRPLAEGRAAFVERLGGLVLGEDPAQGVFRGALFLHPDLGFAVRFPEDWLTRNGPAAVGAESPELDAAVLLERVGQGGGPREAAQAFLSETGLEARGEVTELEIAGLPAVHLRARAQDLELDLTWIGIAGRSFQLTGLASGRAFARHAPLFAEVAKSFRLLAEAERAGIEVVRLRLVRAEAGESPAVLLRRVGGEGSPASLAVMNGIDETQPIEAGRLLKVPVRQRYR